MEDKTDLSNLENLLLQIGIETRKLSQKMLNLTQQIQSHKSNIQEKKNYIKEAQINIKKRQEEIQQKHNTVKCYKENIKSLRRMNNLLLQYEKTLDDELERRQDSCNQDMKMFDERIENYKKIFQKHKEEYCQNPEIIAKENERKTLQVDRDTCDSAQKIIKQHEEQALPSENRSKHQPDYTAYPDHQPQSIETERDDQFETQEKAMETIQDKVDEKHQVAEEEQQEQTADLDWLMNPSHQSDVLEEMRNVLEIEGQRESESIVQEVGCIEGGASSSPMKMTTVQNMTAFSVNSSPNISPGHQESSESPAFLFSLNSRPSTPGFSGFGCSFDMRPGQQEETPFTFTSPYFSNKKSPEGKLEENFLFEELESRPEEFAFSFGSKSPDSNSSIQETGGIGEAFPFSFNFGKF